MLRKVQLNIGVEKMDIHENVIVKALLDSGVTEMFMDRKMAARNGFKLQKLERPVVVRNMNGTNNSKREIIHQVLSLSLDDSRTTRGECLGRTRWSSLLDWTTYLYYFYKWLYTTSPRSYVLLEYSTIT